MRAWSTLPYANAAFCVAIVTSLGVLTGCLGGRTALRERFDGGPASDIVAPPFDQAGRDVSLIFPDLRSVDAPLDVSRPPDVNMRSPICGDGRCEGTETNSTCCSDCGCPDRQLCRVNRCESVRCTTMRECDDGLFCTGTEQCADGVCRAGTPPCPRPVGCVALVCNEGARACVMSPRDDDGDGVGPIRCGGTDCNDDNADINPRVLEVCRDGVDNNCDSRLDCADPACLPECMCPPREEPGQCGNGRDDDCDGVIDCRDSDCRGVTPCPRVCRATELICDDEFDDDCDGFANCRDPDCCIAISCGATCRRDAGRPIDSAVPRDAISVVDVRRVDVPVLRPDVGGDVTCVPTMTFEGGIDACTNGIDDDCDRLPDCRDSDCRPFGSRSECCNGIDDNENDEVDEFTCRCDSADQCAGVGSIAQTCWAPAISVCAPRCDIFGGDEFCRGVLRGRARCDEATGRCVDGSL